MARNIVDDSDVPIESRDQLVGTLESGGKPRDKWRVGTEHEKFGFTAAGLRPVAYEGSQGIRQLLEAMAGMLGWQIVEESGNPIGLVDPIGLGAISLEPGGQFELSGAPFDSVHQTCRELNAHLAQLRECADPLGISFLGIGFSPIWTLDETPRMPKSRYGIMRDYMPKVGALGRDMMFRTCTVQANLDFGDEADMRRKVRVAMALQPIATALFANSPFADGQPNGFLSYRAEVWRHTDADRTGILPFVFEPTFGFESYVDWALDVPMYFLQRGSVLHEVGGASFRDLLEGSVPALPDEQARMSDWNLHLSTLFPEVRLKNFLEVRGADAGPWRSVCALPAFWVGLLYEADVLDEAFQLVKNWTAAEVDELRGAVPRKGLNAVMKGTTVRDIARRVLDLSSEGLRRRARFGRSGADERTYLSGLEETVSIGKTPAERLIEEYRGEWEGDITQLFRRYAY
jgi:glutamate--cysteine ligase